MNLLFTFSFDYKFIKDVSDGLMASGNVFVAITGVKMLAVILIILTWYQKFIKSVDDDGNKLPIKASDIYKGILIVALIGGYDQILNVLDSLLGGIEAEYFANSMKAKSLQLSKQEINDAANPPNWMSAIKEMASMIEEVLSDPFIIVLKILEALFWFFDLMVFGLFLAERFFFLGVLKVFGGLCIACFAVEKLEKWFWSWLSLYVAVFLVCIPYFLVNQFTNKIYEAAELKMNPTLSSDVPDSLFLIVALIFVVILKTKLFLKANEILFKIFS